MSPDQIAAESAARIAAADQEATDATAAFVAGRFDDWWTKRAEALQKRIEAEGERAIDAATADGGQGG